MNQKCKPKKRVCLSLSESALEILDRDKETKYTKGRSQVVEEWAEEKRKKKLEKEWEEQYFEILQSCRQQFLESNGLGGISPINKVTAFDPLLSFISSLLTKQQEEFVKMVEGKKEKFVDNEEDTPGSLKIAMVHNHALDLILADIKSKLK